MQVYRFAVVVPETGRRKRAEVRAGSEAEARTRLKEAGYRIVNEPRDSPGSDDASSDKQPEASQPIESESGSAESPDPESEAPPSKPTLAEFAGGSRTARQRTTVRSLGLTGSLILLVAVGVGSFKLGEWEGFREGFEQGQSEGYAQASSDAANAETQTVQWQAAARIIKRYWSHGRAGALTRYARMASGAYPGQQAYEEWFIYGERVADWLVEQGMVD